MARTERILLRVEPEVRKAIDEARGLIPMNRWVERLILEELAGTGDKTGDMGPPLQRSDHPDPHDPATYGRRPPPRMTGGRKQR